MAVEIVPPATATAHPLHQQSAAVAAVRTTTSTTTTTTTLPSSLHVHVLTTVHTSTYICTCICMHGLPYGTRLDRPCTHSDPPPDFRSHSRRLMMAGAWSIVWGGVFPSSKDCPVSSATPSFFQPHGFTRTRSVSDHHHTLGVPACPVLWEEGLPVRLGRRDLTHNRTSKCCTNI